MTKEQLKEYKELVTLLAKRKQIRKEIKSWLDFLKSNDFTEEEKEIIEDTLDTNNDVLDNITLRIIHLRDKLLKEGVIKYEN